MGKSIFSYNTDSLKTAIINWNIKENETVNNFLVMARAYETSANYLLKVCLKDNFDKKADNLILPILHMSDHSIELYEKAIIKQVHTILNLDYEIDMIHDTMTLFKKMKDAILTKEKTIKRVKDNIDVIEEYLKDLHKHINPQNGKINMDYSRYPQNSKGDMQIYIKNKENVVIDIAELEERLNGIFENIEAILLMYINEE